MVLNYFKVRIKVPVKVVKRNKKFRIVESKSGKIAKNAAGGAIDGGGKASREPVQAQATAVNISQAKKSGTKIPNIKKPQRRR